MEYYLVELIRILQRIEMEGYDLTIDDIKTVRGVKILLGYANPTSLEEGTGDMIQQTFHKRDYLKAIKQ